jgi:DsbC/DsbD-like thiol-disulfide interchange protein
MNKALILLFFLFAPIVLKAQILKPVKWSYASRRISNSEAVIFLKANIDNGWHVYSQNIGKDGPTRTVFKYIHSSNFTLNGKTIEPTPISHFDKVFNMQIGYFEHQVIFQQKIKLRSSGQIMVRGTIEYGTCNDHECLPPEDIEFSIPIKQ